MVVSDRTRKLLWGRSGNRCAICRCELVMSATSLDQESVVGDECHIVARKPDGPRGDPGISEVDVDAYPNLILLCKIHHKLVDDQPSTYTADVLRAQKCKHEQWVRETLHDASSTNARIHIAPRIHTGKEALSIVLNAEAFDFDYDEPANDEEMELIRWLLQNLHDWGDLGFTVESGDRVKAGFELTQYIRNLEDAGFHLFGTVENRKWGVADHTVDLCVAVVRIVRQSDSETVRLGTQEGNPDGENR